MSPILNAVLGPHRFSARSPWGVVSGISAVFAAVILSLVAAIALAAGAAIVSPEQFAACRGIAAIERSPECVRFAISWLGVASVFTIVILFCLSFVKRGSTPGNSLLLRSAGLSWWQYLVCIAGMLSIVYASQFALALATGIKPTDLEQGITAVKTLLDGGGWHVWMLVIGVVVIAGPMSEEFIFRGFLFTTLVQTRLGFIGTAVLTSVIWTGLHATYAWQILAILFIFGICLSYITWRTGSLWPAIVAHSTNNLSSALILFMRG